MASTFPSLVLASPAASPDCAARLPPASGLKDLRAGTDQREPSARYQRQNPDASGALRRHCPDPGRGPAPGRGRPAPGGRTVPARGGGRGVRARAGVARRTEEDLALGCGALWTRRPGAAAAPQSGSLRRRHVGLIRPRGRVRPAAAVAGRRRAAARAAPMRAACAPSRQPSRAASSPRAAAMDTMASGVIARCPSRMSPSSSPSPPPLTPSRSTASRSGPSDARRHPSGPSKSEADAAATPDLVHRALQCELTDHCERDADHQERERDRTSTAQRGRQERRRFCGQYLQRLDAAVDYIVDYEKVEAPAVTEDEFDKDIMRPANAEERRP